MLLTLKGVKRAVKVYYHGPVNGVPVRHSPWIGVSKSPSVRAPVSDPAEPWDRLRQAGGMHIWVFGAEVVVASQAQQQSRSMVWQMRKTGTIKVEVIPIFPAFEAPSSSTTSTHCDIALASPALWAKLTRRSRRDAAADEVFIAVNVPQDRRLSVKGKHKALVLQVERDTVSLWSDMIEYS